MLKSFTVYDIFKRNAILYGSDTALVSGENRITFARLIEQVNALATGLAHRGVSKGDRVGILGLNHEYFFHLFGAVSALGAVLSPINWRLSNEEIQYILKDASPSVLVVDQNQEARVKELADADTSVVPVDNIYGFDNNCQYFPEIKDIMKSVQDFVPESVTQNDDFCIIYTAAVEGYPRGAVLSHQNIIAGNMQTIGAWGLTRSDAYLNMLPLFHITGLNLCMSVLHAGGKNVVMEKFDAKTALELTQTEKISVMGSFSPIMSRLSEEVKKGNYDTSSLKNLTGLEQPDIITEFQEKTGSTFWPLYGQSETSGTITLAPFNERPGSAGRPALLSEIALVDDTDTPVPTGEAGEIVVRGPMVFNGYWHQEELNRKTFKNQWHHTGDLAKFDDDGYLWFVSRKPEKELIKPGGENVYPAEVEEVIRQHPDIETVSVIGVPDPEFGEGIKAVCVLKKGKTLEAKDLINYVAGKIARYKKPRYVDFVTALPLTPSGAIDRVKVKELYGN
jgi:acyl-CoA synthetase (AMP-forming)/AMP-acid ligase II